MPQLAKGKAQLSTQVREELLTRFRKYAEGRGEKLTAALERAMEREMAYPPDPVPLQPLGPPQPPGAATAPPAKRKKT